MKAPASAGPTAVGFAVVFAPAVAVAAAVALAPALAAAGLDAQTPLLIPDSVVCDSCVIEWQQVATISDATFPGGALINTASVHANSDGAFLVVAGRMLDELFVADRTGAIQRRIGRTGEGPGEYLHPAYIVEHGESFWVFDTGARRITILGSSDLEPVGMRPMPAVLAMNVAPLVFPDGSYLITGRSGDRALAGYRFFLFDAEGALIRSFGSWDDPKAERVGSTAILAPSGPGAFWVGSNNLYRLERWSVTGERLVTIEREADWFSNDPVDSERRLTVPQTVLDPRTGSVLARDSLVGMSAYPASGGFLLKHETDSEQGLMLLELLRPVLVGAGSGGPRPER